MRRNRARTTALTGGSGRGCQAAKAGQTEGALAGISAKYLI
jgi:hypothetical protein